RINIRIEIPIHMGLPGTYRAIFASFLSGVSTAPASASQGLLVCCPTLRRKRWQHETGRPVDVRLVGMVGGTQKLVECHLRLPRTTARAILRCQPLSYKPP